MLVLVAGCGRGPEDAGGTADSEETQDTRSEVDAGPVRVVAEVQPGKVRLSDEPKLTLTIDYEEGVTLDKPPFGQSLGSFKIRDFREPLPKVRQGRQTIEQIYTLEPMDTGKLTIDPISVTFIDNRPDGDGRQHTIETEALLVEVASLVGAEAPSLKQLRPPAGPVELPYRGPWLACLLGGAVLAGATTGLLLWYRNRRRKAASLPVPSPGETACRQLDELVQSRLAERDVKLFYVELTGIVRRYIEQTTGIRAPEQTTEEFLREIAGTHTFSREESLRLKDFLESADLVKFAAHRPRPQDLEASVTRAKLFIGPKRQEAAA